MSGKKTFTAVCIAVTMLAVAAFAVMFIHQRDMVAPVLELTVDGLTADTPSEVQRLCRAEHERYAELLQEHPGCVWLWCGENKLCLAKQERLTELDAESGFTQVGYRDEKGEDRIGWLVDPAAAPNELGRIGIGDVGVRSFDSVSMSLRVAIRKGEIDFPDAVYLWEDGSSEVIAVKAALISDPVGSQISFTDDGGVVRNCYVLDTSL